MVEKDESSVPTKLEEVKEEKETPSEPSTEEKPVDTKEGDLETKPEEKPEGEELKKETPEETPEVSDGAEDREAVGLKAQQEKLKIEIKDNIVNLRAQRREMRKQDTPVPQPVKDEEIDPEADDQFNKWAEKKGFVPKEQIISELNRKDFLVGTKNADQKFYDDNPEYIYSLELRQAHDNIMDSLKEAPTAEEYQKQLELAHNVVKQNNPTLFPSSSDSTLAAKKQALDLAGKGKGGQAGSPPTESAISSQQENEFRRAGYSEEEIKRMRIIKQNK